MSIPNSFPPIELLRVAVFVLLVGAVFAAAGLVLLRQLLARVRKRPAPRLRRRHWLVLGASAAGVLCILYGRFIEPYWLEVRTLEIESAKVPRGAEPLRIVHVSDLQSDPTERLEGRLPDEIAALSPDVIVFTGDAVNSREALPVFTRCLTRLAAIAPTYVVKGNWDAWLVPDVDHFGGTGAIELDGTFDVIDVRGVPLQLIGTSMDRPDGIELATRVREHAPSAEPQLDPSAFTVALFHPPVPEVVPARLRGSLVDLMVAGHVHGGQVALPFYGALITLSPHGKRFESGLYEVDGMQLHVSRGVGMEGGSAPRVRFCARPEITLLLIVPPDGQ